MRDQDGHGFRFPRYRIPAGGYVKVHTGSGQDRRGDLFWGVDNFVWNNDGDAAALRYQAKTRERLLLCGKREPQSTKVLLMARSVRGWLIARFMGDVNEVKRGRMGRRIGRRVAGKATGQDGC